MIRVDSMGDAIKMSIITFKFIEYVHFTNYEHKKNSKIIVTISKEIHAFVIIL